MQIEDTKTVRELVTANPAAARVFEKFGIDYCCGGNKSLTEACLAAKVRAEDVAAALEKPEPRPDERDWQRAALGELADYIVRKHHAFTREEIQRLEPLIAKVVSVHGQNHQELQQIQSLFRGLAQEMTMHMMKEEHMLFPYIKDLEEAVNRHLRPSPPMFGTVQNPVRMMMAEHDSSGQVLHKMREITNGYAAPSDACVSYQTLYRALHAFETDLHQHIHLENNILFPRAVELEAEAK
jgi:regulator of cell morphogenesis and NO signaling